MGRNKGNSAKEFACLPTVDREEFFVEVAVLESLCRKMFVTAECLSTEMRQLLINRVLENLAESFEKYWQEWERLVSEGRWSAETVCLVDFEGVLYMRMQRFNWNCGCSGRPFAQHGGLYVLYEAVSDAFDNFNKNFLKMRSVH
ncbi:hypothetical protein A2533_03120 [Candidatus Falkowbacteria bacterium RIFOXYD2_FULL_35_9]|uniref:Uncharacterized protein n=1 Tax=Candidatus Falkowbacteria bacterium RIFOXYC2_FULL_36_12 TaxID=1798002 RepID=A0A1F5SVX1_9BACT|nr:MAG: hypothetical protein A2478_00335 [Candidatus Falkowbacteria bacterium RIFOXYC2_FULL_36_12]OGF31465.1 MAG: hypothetical protein A2300_00135 [Candidatus Falkowbacteria bacterium RIFOXYB2_FULL_35_7]OGF33587.1 MAG: hypothetical protein A2223_03470 [Candidatus Falkowbacteria bacterium RIFOXYA2_FULL_35_8]OGF46964.1 MAG: hypothetical protein A2533_03120 [Candidatus Falkowbacteria bacterium RIFOXYD2_FULL_35_9]